MFKKPLLLTAMLACTFALLGGSLTVAPAAEAAAQVTNPCDRLTKGQVKYSGHGANRVTFTTTTHRSRSAALITSCKRSGNRYVQKWQSRGYVGTNGFKAPGVPSGHTKYEYSPTGSFSVTEGFGLRNPGTSLKYRTLNPKSRWGGRPGRLYNKYFQSSRHIWPDEDMWYFATRSTGDYRQGAVINYNRGPGVPIRQGEGFAIFLHANPVPTAGCISLPERTVVKFLRSATKGDRIIMGAVNDVFTPYSSNPFGAITQKYAAYGGQVRLGNPTSNLKTGLKNRGSMQHFRKGSIHRSPATGAHVTVGSMRGAWKADGWERGPLGYPTSDPIRVSGGKRQNFQGGSITWSRATGSRPVIGEFNRTWKRDGALRGQLGYPTTKQRTGTGGVTRQYFQGGKITKNDKDGIFITYK